jgi:hypothetical protein
MGTHLHKDKWISATPLQAVLMLLLVLGLAACDAAVALLARKPAP